MIFRYLISLFAVTTKQPIVIAIIQNQQQQILIAQRQKHQLSPHLWEFPGGKVEATDSNLVAALKREIMEEVGVTPIEPIYLFNISYQYNPQMHIELHVWHVTEFIGEPYGAEGQAIRWIAIQDLRNYDFPAANQSIIKWLTLALRSS